MELLDAVRVFSALGNATRLRAFRMLVKAGPSGLTAGAISRSLQAPPSTVTAHLGRLVQSGLMKSWRSERNIYYAVRVEQVRQIISYLTVECCQGQPELCGFGDEDANVRQKAREKA